MHSLVKVTHTYSMFKVDTHIPPLFWFILTTVKTYSMWIIVSLVNNMTHMTRGHSEQ